MSKGANDGRRERALRPLDEAPPPPLSEELIEKLQNAVSAARRKRIPERNDPAATPAPDGQS